MITCVYLVPGHFCQDTQPGDSEMTFSVFESSCHLLFWLTT